jgi:two-component system chemotaxis response regulator CheY
MGFRTLVVDDSSFQRTIVSDILDDRFEIVDTAENGHEAVSKFEELDPDVITLDIVMPEMDGIEALTEIKNRSPETIVVMCTSVEQEQKMRAAAKAGANGYVTKPISEDKLLSEFDSLLE